MLKGNGGGSGGVVTIVLWVAIFPIMLLLSLVFGIRRFIEVKRFRFFWQKDDI